ncbi:MAG: MOSC domain-containing protein [Phycisphaerae bacterium]|jgi:MOSC domain-containing protein YiiM|nr:MOSC domain-containing protein [Phycisphaerae bacterium]
MGGTVGRVVSVNISGGKGTSKKAVAEGRFRCDVGLVGDAHAGPGIRQVSLLAAESIARQQEVLESRRQEGKCPKAHGEDFNLRPGSFAENLTIEGIDLAHLPIGTKLKIGGEVEMEITKIGKECHVGCEIFKMLGNCIMPREGVFSRVLSEGTVRPGDEVVVECE